MSGLPYLVVRPQLPVGGRQVDYSRQDLSCLRHFLVFPARVSIVTFDQLYHRTRYLDDPMTRSAVPLDAAPNVSRSSRVSAM